ncbi:hypothetical protein GOBAR_DD25141 [Gossypium barbadense]|nr:hypothetical protein GOBAR_DD25141 [Gossypium barbadense]
MEGQTNTSFWQWLGTMQSWKWAQSFDEGFRYCQMTTNLVEGINAVLLKIRHLPISSVFSATFYRLATLMPRMAQQQVNQMEVGHVFVEDVRDAMVANRRIARSMTVEGYIFVELDVHGTGDYAIRHSSVTWRSVYCIRHIATNFQRDYKNAYWKRQVVRMVHELEPHIFRQRMARLEIAWRVKPTHLSGSGWVPCNRGNGLKVLTRAFVIVK